MRLLLINPRFPESFWSFRWARQRILPGRKALHPPLGLATVAALTPPDWEVRIVDEEVESLPAEPDADVVGIGGMGVQFPRQKELLRYYRGRGCRVVAGGSYASLVPERYRELADTVVAGEAEYTWPEFCRDLEAGRAKSLYQETGVVDLRDSPVPRFDLLQPARYHSLSLQFSRGCPYRCEFCDIIVMFGRKPRTKTPEQVGRELDALRGLGVRRAFFVDDNFVGDRPQAKVLLRYLADYQRKHPPPFLFGTEASVNAAQDPELLDLLREANFGWLFLGIESPEEESLKETRKYQNTGRDLLGAVRTLYGRGLDVLGGFIVGFDHDTQDTFERQYDFIMRSGIQAAMVGLLTASERTPLYERLRKEGRLRSGSDGTDNVRAETNVLPKRMSYEELLAGFRHLQERLFTDASIAARIRTKLRHLRRPRGALGGIPYRPREAAGILARLLFRGVLRGGVRRVALFARTFPWRRPALALPAIEDWIVGLSLQDYVKRRLRAPAPSVAERLKSYRRRLERALAPYRRAGAVEIAFAGLAEEAATLSLRLKGHLDPRFVRRAARSLRRLLRRTPASLTLHVEFLDRAERPQLDRLLRRLSRYGDRVRITVADRVREWVQIDSSVFLLSLAPEVE